MWTHVTVKLCLLWAQAALILRLLWLAQVRWSLKLSCLGWSEENRGEEMNGNFSLCDYKKRIQKMLFQT